MRVKIIRECKFIVNAYPSPLLPVSMSRDFVIDLITIVVRIDDSSHCMASARADHRRGLSLSGLRVTA